jgi:hypothetical protein
MNRRIQSKVSAFDELEFPLEPSIRIIILKVIGFANIIIVEFDITTPEVGDIAMGVNTCWFFYENCSLAKDQFKC